MTGTKYAAGLRALAEFYETHPEVPTPSTSFDVWLREKDRGSFLELAKIIGYVEKDAIDRWFILRKHFGPITLDFNVARDVVCERIVVGEREVPERYEPAHTEEIVEWRCPESLLAEEVEP